MNCQDFENQIQRLLDQRADLSTNSAIQCHASQCDDCAQMLRMYGDLFEPESPSNNPFDLLANSNAEPTGAVNLNSDEQLQYVDYDPSHSSNFEFTRRTQQLTGVLVACVSLTLVVWLSFISTGNSVDHTPIANHGIEDVRSSDAKSNRDSNNLAFTKIGAEQNKADGSELSQNPERSNNNSSEIVNDSFWNSKLESTQVAFQSRHPIESLQSYYKYTSSLPGVKPWASGINHAARLIQKSIEEKPQKTKKSNGMELGRKYDSFDWSIRTVV